MIPGILMAITCGIAFYTNGGVIALTAYFGGACTAFIGIGCHRELMRISKALDLLEKIETSGGTP